MHTVVVDYTYCSLFCILLCCCWCHSNWKSWQQIHTFSFSLTFSLSFSISSRQIPLHQNYRLSLQSSLYLSISTSCILYIILNILFSLSPCTLFFPNPLSIAILYPILSLAPFTNWIIGLVLGQFIIVVVTIPIIIYSSLSCCSLLLSFYLWFSFYLY